MVQIINKTITCSEGAWNDLKRNNNINQPALVIIKHALDFLALSKVILFCLLAKYG